MQSVLSRAAASTRRADNRAARTARRRRGRADRRSPPARLLVWSWPGLSRQTQHPLPDDRALNLARPAHDRVGSSGQPAASPFTGREQGLRSEHRTRSVVQTLAALGPHKFHHTRLRPDLVAAGQPGQGASVVETEDLDIDPRLNQPLADTWVVEGPGNGA